MENYEKKINELRDYMSQKKGEAYPIKNKLLAEQDEFLKSLYFKMLCMLARCSGEANDMQMTFLLRLISGAETENTLQDYMRMSMEVETKDLDDFVSFLGESELRFYFCIDGGVLMAANQENNKYELFAEMIQLLHIQKEELEFLMAIVRSVCMQDSKQFTDAFAFTTKSTSNLEVYQYAKEFHKGLIVSSPYLTHIASPNMDKIDLSQYDEKIYTADKVIIENIQADMEERILFSSCSEVIFRNCKFFGQQNEKYFDFYMVKKVTMENCEFRDFNHRAALFRNTSDVIIRNCLFDHCGNVSKYEDGNGGVFRSQGGYHSFVMESNQFSNCYLNGYDSHVDLNAAIVLHFTGNAGTLSVRNNTFSGCRSSRYNRGYNRYSSNKICFISNTVSTDEFINENNIGTGGVHAQFCEAQKY